MMDGQPPEPLRIGVLGAARIAALAIAGPAHTTGDRLVAVAARDRRRAEAFAASHGVERVLDTYANLVTHGRLDDRDRVESLSPLPRTPSHRLAC